MSNAEATQKKLMMGPEGYTKIALLGTATSMSLAPFNDKSWAIWACSPGAYPICAQNRSDVWFEPHRWMPSQPGKAGFPGTKPWFSPEFHQFLKEHKGPVFMAKKEESIPNSVAIPFKELIAKYGPYFFTSTVSYMLAVAIDTLAPRAAAGENVMLGLWGIDMATTEEWSYQRPACQHFVGLAMSLGIDVMLPPESDLMRPSTMYGIGEYSPRHIRLLARLRDCEANKAAAMQQAQQIGARMAQLDGQIGELKYFLDIWSDDLEPDLKQAVSFSQEFHRPLGTLRKQIAEVTDSTGAAVVTLPSDKTA